VNGAWGRRWTPAAARYGKGERTLGDGDIQVLAKVIGQEVGDAMMRNEMIT